MKIRFVKDVINDDSMSEHNYLAALCARYDHSVRYYSGTYDVAYGFALHGMNTYAVDIKNAAKKICIKYDDTSVSESVKYDEIITFGKDGKYSTYPIDTSFVHLVKPIDNTFIFGTYVNINDNDKYMEMIGRTSGDITIALPGYSSNMDELCKLIKSIGRVCNVCKNINRDIMETYIRTSKNVIGLNGGFYTSMHSFASYVAIHGDINYISDTDIVEPTTIQKFIESESVYGK